MQHHRGPTSAIDRYAQIRVDLDYTWIILDRLLHVVVRAAPKNNRAGVYSMASNNHALLEGDPLGWEVLQTPRCQGALAT